MLFELFYHKSDLISAFLTLSALGGAGPSIALGGEFDPHFCNSSPGAYWAIILFLFKKKINEYLEEKNGSIS